MSENLLSHTQSRIGWKGLLSGFVVVCLLDSLALYYATRFTALLYAMLLMPLTFLLMGLCLVEMRAFRRADTALLILFAVWFFLSAALSEYRAGAFLDNRDYLYALCMQLFVCYPLGSVLDEKPLRRTLRTAAAVSVVLLFLLDAFAVYAACTNQYFTFDMGAEYGVGVYTETVLDSAFHRLTTLYHPNSVGMFSGLAALLSLYLALTTEKKPWCKGLLFLTLPVFYVCITMSASRTAMICLCVAGALMLFRYLWFRLQTRKLAVRLPAALLAALALSALLTVLSAPANAALQRISNRSADAAAQAAASSAAPVEEAPAYADSATAAAVEAIGEDTLILDRSVEAEGFSMSGRTTIWKKALDTVKATPLTLLFGISPAQVGPVIGPQLNIWTNLMHSSFVQILVSCGVVGLLLFLAFLVLLAVRCIRLFFRADTDALKAGYLPVLLVFLLLSAFLESFLVIFPTPFFASLWCFLCAGVVMRPAYAAKKADRA